MEHTVEQFPLYPPENCLACPLRPLEKFLPLDRKTILRIQTARVGTRRFLGGAMICRAGEPASTAFTVFDGFALEFRFLENGARQVTRFILPGDSILIPDSPTPVWPDSVEAVDHVVACALAAEALGRLLRSQPEIARLLAQVREIEEAVLKEHLTDLGRRPAQARIVRQFLELFYRCKLRGRTLGNRCHLPFRQQQIADAVGVTPEYLSRVLIPLRKEGLTFQHGWLEILELESLASRFDYNPGYLQPHPAALNGRRAVTGGHWSTAAFCRAS